MRKFFQTQQNQVQANSHDHGANNAKRMRMSGKYCYIFSLVNKVYRNLSMPTTATTSFDRVHDIIVRKPRGV